MKWVVLGLFVLSLPFIGFGLADYGRQQGMDKMGGAILSMIGFGLLALDAVILLMWGAVKLMMS